ncbi:hypothetical protein CGRA01v4_03381 [Colletotrichum graminicola]|nr:hypothetical protein CGRA01v4_03381 [Colletotrichum graminicola]
MCCASPSASEAEDLVISRKPWRGQILRLEGTCGQGGKGDRDPPISLTGLEAPGHRRVGLHAFLLAPSRIAGSARREPRFPPAEQKRERGRDEGNRCLTRLKGHERRPHPHLHPSKRHLLTLGRLLDNRKAGEQRLDRQARRLSLSEQPSSQPHDVRPTPPPPPCPARPLCRCGPAAGRAGNFCGSQAGVQDAIEKTPPHA